MPKGDGTGPQGKGSGTGRRLGPCSGIITKRPVGRGKAAGPVLARRKKPKTTKK